MFTLSWGWWLRDPHFHDSPYPPHTLTDGAHHVNRASITTTAFTALDSSRIGGGSVLLSHLPQHYEVSTVPLALPFPAEGQGTQRLLLFASWAGKTMAMECPSVYVATRPPRWRRKWLRASPTSLIFLHAVPAPPPLPPRQGAANTPWPCSNEVPERVQSLHRRRRGARASTKSPSSAVLLTFIVRRLASFLLRLSTALFLPLPPAITPFLTSLSLLIFNSFPPFHPSLHPTGILYLRATDIPMSGPRSRPGWPGATALHQ